MAGLRFQSRDFIKSRDNYQSSGALEKLNTNKDVARVLNTPEKRRFLYTEMKKAGPNKLKELFGKWRFGKEKSLFSDDQIRIIAKGVYGSGVRYKMPKESPEESRVEKRAELEKNRIFGKKEETAENTGVQNKTASSNERISEYHALGQAPSQNSESSPESNKPDIHSSNIRELNK